jgi:DNA polymerase III alpha subunit
MSTTPQFTHLHLHTEYSLLDGANKIKPLAKKVKEMGMTSVAMTDHGNLFGAIDFYNAKRKVLNQSLEWKLIFITVKKLEIKLQEKDFTYVYTQKIKLDIKT